MRTLAALLVAFIILALPSLDLRVLDLPVLDLPVLDLPLRALLIFPALGLLARWSETTPGEPHDP